MKLVSWNVNGIRAAIRKGAFQSMMKELRPDIVCLQETKAERGQAEIDLPEYEEYWNSATKKGYSGTAIFTKHPPMSVALGFPPPLVARYQLKDGFGDLNAEGRVIALEFENFFVVTVYTPNAKPDLSRLTMRHQHWDPAFFDFVTGLERVKPVLISGDLNVAHTEDDLANPKANEGEHGFTKEEREGMSRLITDARMVDAFRLFHTGNGHYTWWSNFGRARERNAGWRIDYWLVSEDLKNKVKHCTIHPSIMGSDHCPVELHIRDHD